MKQTLLFLAIIILSSCSPKQEKIAESQSINIGKAKIEFSTLNFDFGTIKQGEEIIISFDFKNIGDAPLIIYKVEPSCGCTVSKYPREPIKIGENGKINLIFKSAGFYGYQIKTAKVYTNTQDSIITLTIHGYVE